MLGSDSKQWKIGIPHFSRVVYENVYPNTDVIYYGDGGRIRYDLVLRPGAEPEAIRLRVDGAERIAVRREGLAITTPSGEFQLDRPVIYQNIEGKRREIAGQYRLESEHIVAFDVPSYDASYALIIDPTLTYSTFLGGDGDELAAAIAVDDNGNAYISGATKAADFPTTPGVLQRTRTSNGLSVLFVSKLNAAGSDLVYSTYIASNNAQANDYVAPRKMVVDDNGNAYIAGLASSSAALATTEGAFQRTSGGGPRPFVLKLNATGSALDYSTYLWSGSDETASDRADSIHSIAVDSAGNAYLVGQTSSPHFPTTSGVIQPLLANAADAFVTKLNAAGSDLSFSTFLGGSSTDLGFRIAVDSESNVYVAGTTESSDFPVSADAFQIVRSPTLAGQSDAFLLKLNPNGTSLLYSTYLGGNNSEFVETLDVDASGNATVAGTTGATNFPTTAGAYMTSKTGDSAGFLTQFNTNATSLIYSTLLPPFAYAAAGGQGKFYFLGLDIFAFDPSTSAMLYTTRLPGAPVSAPTSLNAIAADLAGSVYITGQTDSPTFPTTPGGYQPALKVTPTPQRNFGFKDAFIVKIGPERAAPVISSLSPASATAGSVRGSLTLVVRGINFEAGSVVVFNGVRRTTTYMTIAELRASIPAADFATTGQVEVSVETPGVGTSAPGIFSIGANPVPAITSISPSTAQSGGPTLVALITGSGFIQSSVVRLNGANRPTTFMSDTRLTVQIRNSDTENSGVLQVSVFNPEPGGGLSNAVNFTVTTGPIPPTVDVPSITELIPATTRAGSGTFTLSVIGAGFVSGRSSIQWGDSRLLSSVVENPNRIRVNIPGSFVASEGNVEVTVINAPPGGGISNRLTFKVAPPLPPIIQSLSQNSVAAGSPGFTLSINGDNLLDGAKVKWNGQEKPTTMVRSGPGLTAQLRISVSAEDLERPGLAYITVTNPAPDGSTTKALTFTIYEVRVLDLAANDLLYDPSRGKLYASRPAVSRTDRNTISQIDPEAGTVERSLAIGNEPAKLALSDDYQSLYVVLDDGRQIRQADLSSFSAGLQFALETPNLVQDIKVLPGTQSSVLVSMRNGGVAVYDNAVKRPRQASAVSAAQLGFSKSGRAYGCAAFVGQNTEMYAITIDASGVSVDSTGRRPCRGKFEAANGIFYMEEGTVVDPEARVELGRHPLRWNNNLVRPDTTTRKTFYLTSGGNQVATLHVFDERSFTLTGSFDIQGVTATPSALVRFGSNGIAFRTAADQIFLVRVPDALFAESYISEMSQFANGGGYTSSIIVTNPSSTQVARGTINLFGDDGFAFYALVYDHSAAIPFTLPPLGSATFTLPAANESLLATGSARLSSNIPVSGVVRFGSSVLGIAGVGANAALQAMIVPVVRDSARRLNTGVAMSNPQPETIDVSLTLRALDGSEVAGAAKTERSTPNGHLARFVEELFPALQADFQGTLTVRTITAGKKVAAIALQLGATPGEFTTLPAVSLEPTAVSSQMLFPQFATGAGVSSSIFLVNPSETVSRGTLRFFDDSGTPVRSNIPGADAPEVPFTISPNGGTVLTSRDSGNLVAGWVKATSDSAIGGALRFSSPGLGIAGVGAAAVSYGFITPVSRSESANVSTGVAVVSTESSVVVSLTLRDHEGNPVPNGNTTLLLPGNGHVSRFIHELFPAADTRQFKGTLTVTSDGGPIAGIAIQLGTMLGEFTTLPVMPIQ